MCPAARMNLSNVPDRKAGLVAVCNLQQCQFVFRCIDELASICPELNAVGVTSSSLVHFLYRPDLVFMDECDDIVMDEFRCAHSYLVFRLDAARTSNGCQIDHKADAQSQAAFPPVKNGTAVITMNKNDTKKNMR